jgi:Mlc titration factor MtfA (ptsG expression regulator)
VFTRLRAWRDRRILAAARLDPGVWQSAVADLPLLTRLGVDELERLRRLVVLFLHHKTLEPVGGCELSEPMRLRIAALACLPILNLGLEYYRGFYAVVVYPGGFRARHEHVEEDGTVHHSEEELVGEAWEQGPVILSWDDVETASNLDGFNVVIHECAHKLDMLLASANGLPPLHAGMRVEEWSAAFNAAFEDLQQRADAGEETEIDPYAAESPAEFFAVSSEAFFELPQLLKNAYPAVYAQLSAFYRQDPAARLW